MLIAFRIHWIINLLSFCTFQPGTKPKIIHADSQADVVSFRQDTIDPHYVDWLHRRHDYDTELYGYEQYNTLTINTQSLCEWMLKNQLPGNLNDFDV